jgi:hypothetical protein
MASSTELVAAICALIRTNPEPVPITFRKHTVDEAATVGAIVDRCHAQETPLHEVYVDPELAAELGLAEGKMLPHGSHPTIRCESGLWTSSTISPGLRSALVASKWTTGCERAWASLGCPADTS